MAPLVSERGGVFDDHTEVSSADSCGDSTDEGGAAAAFAAAGVVHARRASRAGGSKAGGGAVSASNVVTARSTGVPELDAFAPSGGATVMEDVANLVRGVLQRLPGTEEATESVVAQALADTAARHALSATYAVAVGDLLEFPLQVRRVYVCVTCAACQCLFLLPALLRPRRRGRHARRHGPRGGLGC